MEPVKGGNLVKLPEDAKKILDDLHGGSPASYALRFAAGFDGVLMVLSGMSNLEQMMDNISFMKNFEPLNEKELEAVHQVAEIFHQKHMIPCTACRYCVAGCPKHISIPDLFSCMNAKMVFHDWNADYYYNMVHTARNGKASECVKCGKCEKVCPQHLKIREILEDVAKEFEKISRRSYGLFEEYRMEDADYAMVIIGSAAGTGKDTVDMLRKQGVRAGLLKIRLFRPVPAEEIAEALKNVKYLAIMDRTEDYNGHCGPFGAEIKSTLYNADLHPATLNYCYGIGGRDVTVESLASVFEDLKTVEETGKLGETYRYLSVRE